MKTKILIGALTVSILLTLYFMLGKPPQTGDGGDGGGFPVLSAIPVLHSDSTITSESEALVIFNQYFNEITENTKEELSKYGKSDEAEIIQEMNFFDEFTTVEKRSWENDQYWLGLDKSAYVFTVPATSKYENWEKRDEEIFVERVKCKGFQPGQGISIPTELTTYEDIKSYLNENCPEGTEIYWETTELKIKYLMDGNGVVYWAGHYLRTKPWLGY